MDKKLKEIEIRLMAINSIIEKLDPAIKLAAFEILKPLLLGHNVKVDSRTPKQNDVNGESELRNVFDINGEDIKLTIKTVPGKNNKEKIINVALLYLFGVDKARNVREVDKKEIMDVCKEHGCMDSANFANHIRSNKQLLIVTSKKIKITQPGLNKAKELINSINEEGGK